MKYLYLLIKKFFKGPWYDHSSKSYYNYYSDGNQSYYAYSHTDKDWYAGSQLYYDTYDKKTGKKAPHSIGYNNIED